MIVSSIVGGLAAFAAVTLITRRVEKGGKPGRLYYGAFMWVTGIGGLLMALGPFVALLAGRGGDLTGWFFLSAAFGAAAVYCLGEAAFVRGTFDEDGIVFSTPWTGTKRESWKNVASIEFSSNYKWYAITFASGAVVRLSLTLYGCHAAVTAAQRRFALYSPHLQRAAKKRLGGG